VNSTKNFLLIEHDESLRVYSDAASCAMKNARLANCRWCECFIHFVTVSAVVINCSWLGVCCL